MNQESPPQVEVPDLAARLTSLGNTAAGLGDAIRGLSKVNGCDALVKELGTSLKFVCKRLTWLERTSDPNWSKYSDAARGKSARQRDDEFFVENINY